jgi:capsular polysaccharide biosynthesis protein
MISSDNEIKIINLLKEYANNFNLNFCIFNGQIDGQRMSTKEQIKLFRFAKMVVGPHGGGLANIIWIDPKNECKICEFTYGTEKTIQSLNGFEINCNFSYSSLPDEIFEYSVIPFTNNSRDNIVEIDIDNLMKFLYETNSDSSIL